MRITGGTAPSSIYLVIDNTAANAIATVGTGGFLITEGEYNRVKWNIGTAASGSYTLPFSDIFSNKIPFTLSINSAGVGTGNILFSTYMGIWDNNTYKPSDVTNMSSSGITNNSDKVIDRFWIIDASGYTTKPNVNLSFTYIDAEHTAAGNTIIEANLRAQRFNSTINDWGDYAPQGTINTATNVVSAVPVSPGNFFRSWTLVDNSVPLPVELLYFKSNCQNDGIQLSWATATETNNNYFEIERALDATNFQNVRTIPGAGNSSHMIKYTIFDSDSFFVPVYYRLKQVDYDGTEKIYSNYIIAAKCASKEKEEILIFYSDDGKIMVSTYLSQTGNYDIMLYDAIGQLVSKETKNLEKGNSIFELSRNTLSYGIYLIIIADKRKQMIKKIVYK